jgi:hypothetical protein
MTGSVPTRIWPAASGYPMTMAATSNQMPITRPTTVLALMAAAAYPMGRQKACTESVAARASARNEREE